MFSAVFFLLATLFTACGDDKANCEIGDKQCSDDLLQVCTADGWEDEQDCAADNMSCMTMDEPDASHCHGDDM